MRIVKHSTKIIRSPCVSSVSVTCMRGTCIMLMRIVLGKKTSRTNKRQKRSRSATSVSRSCQKETVRDILDRKSRSRRQETEEVKNRLKAAWAAFHKIRQELTSKDYRLCHRLRLFKMVNTPTIDIRKWNVDIITETRKNHQDHAPKDASPYCSNE